MTKIKWFFTSKYKRLLYHIECAHQNKQRLHLGNGIILDFTSDSTNDRLKLKEYESTGLTPEQIKEIDMLYREKCKELASYKMVEGKFYYGQQLYIKKRGQT